MSLKRRNYPGLSERLREARVNKNWNQCRLGRLSGIRRETINKLEHGHTSPHDYTIDTLANTLNVTAEWLKYGGDNNV